MFPVYESKLNRTTGEPIITRMVQREDETNYVSEPDGAEQTCFSKSSTFRNRADAEKQNEVLASKGRNAAIAFAKAIQERESKTASTVAV
jgi:hypothetical protein